MENPISNRVLSQDTRVKSKLLGIKNFKFLRVLVSLLLIFLLLSKVDLLKLGQFLLSIKVRLVLLSVLLYVAGQILCTSKWRFLLSSLGLNKRFPKLVSLYFIGMFFNLFMPTIIGGDTLRIYYASNGLEQFPAVASSVFMERSTGFFALFSIAILSSLFFPFYFQGYSIFWLLLGGFAFFIMAFFFMFKPWIYQLIAKLLKIIGLERLPSKFNEICRTLNIYKDKKRWLVVALIYSFIFQFTLIGINILNAKSLGIVLNPKYFFYFVPAIAIIGMVPISINGIGIREASYTILFMQVGLTKEQSFSLAILWLIVVALSSLPGGIIYVFSKKR